jgi:hypothetical protein
MRVSITKRVTQSSHKLDLNFDKFGYNHSMKTKINLLTVLSTLATILFQTPTARAELTLFDQNNWKLGFAGFVEVDSIYDSVRGLGEIANSKRR